MMSVDSKLLLVDVVVLTRDADIVNGVGVFVTVLSMVSMVSNELLYIHSFFLSYTRYDMCIVKGLGWEGKG
jgi:hypothetical protein